MDDLCLKVLLVEDDEDDFVLTREFLAETRGGNFQLDWVEDYDAGLAAVHKNEHDVYLVDYRLGKNNGLELLRAAMVRATPTIVVLT